MDQIIPKKYAPYAVLAGLIVLMALIVWLGVMPMRQAISGKMDDIQKFYTARENRERQVARLPELEEQFREIVAGEEAMRILLEEDRIVDFVKTLEELAAETGVEIVIESKESSAIVEKKPTAKAPAEADGAASTASKKTAKQGIADQLPYDRYLHINVSLKGEYADIIRFLYKMETLPFALDVIATDVRLNEDTEERSVVPEAGRNPFMLVPVGDAALVVPSQDDGQEAQGKRFPIEADFDTVVYIRK